MIQWQFAFFWNNSDYNFQLPWEQKETNSIKIVPAVMFLSDSDEHFLNVVFEIIHTR